MTKGWLDAVDTKVRERATDSGSVGRVPRHGHGKMNVKGGRLSQRLVTSPSAVGAAWESTCMQITSISERRTVTKVRTVAIRMGIKMRLIQIESAEHNTWL